MKASILNLITTVTRRIDDQRSNLNHAKSACSEIVHNAPLWAITEEERLQIRATRDLCEQIEKRIRTEEFLTKQLEPKVSIVTNE